MQSSHTLQLTSQYQLWCWAIVPSEGHQIGFYHPSQNKPCKASFQKSCKVYKNLCDMKEVWIIPVSSSVFPHCPSAVSFIWLFETRRNQGVRAGKQTRGLCWVQFSNEVFLFKAVDCRWFLHRSHILTLIVKSLSAWLTHMQSMKP